MAEKPRELSLEEKLWAVKEYLDGKGSTYSIADKYGVTDTSIRRWVDRYKNGGERTFSTKPLPSNRSPAEKLQAVHEYLDGAVSLRDVALRYGVGTAAYANGLQNISQEGMLLFFQTMPRRITAEH